MLKTLGKISMVALLAVALFGVGTAKADTITDGHVQFTAFVTATTVELQITCLDLAVCGGDYLGSVSVKGLSFSGTPTDLTEPTGYVVDNGGQNNGVNNDCNGTQGGSAVCWQAPSTLTATLSGTPVTFEAGITDGSGGLPRSTLHVQATGYNNDTGSQQGGGKVFAVSDDLGAGGTITAPETGTSMLLGVGLLSLLGLVGISGRRQTGPAVA